MICKEFHWRSEDGQDFNSSLCTPSLPKTIHFGGLFKPFMFDLVSADGHYELRGRLWKLELIAHKHFWDINTDEFYSFCLVYWRGKTIFRRHRKDK